MSKIARVLLPTVTALSLASAFSVVYAQSSADSMGSRSGSLTEDSATRSSGTSGAGMSSGASRSGSSADTAADDKAVQNLLAAAQSLREAIQRMAQMPPGERRAEAIREGNEALIQVQTAIASLPSHLLVANAKEADYKKAMDKMKQASDRLYNAADALANQPAGKKTDNAIKQVNKALLETNEAMLTGMQLSAAGSATTTGSSGSGASTSASGSGGEAGDTVKGPTRANDIGVMDSPSSRDLRSGTGSASDSAGSTNK